METDTEKRPVTTSLSLDKCTCIGQCRQKLSAYQEDVLSRLALLPEGGILVQKNEVGLGRTTINILASVAVAGCKKAMLIVEPAMRFWVTVEYERLREHFRVPSLICDNGYGYVVLGAPTLHFVPRAQLSRPDGTTFIETLAPDRRTSSFAITAARRGARVRCVSCTISRSRSRARLSGRPDGHKDQNDQRQCCL